jgi:hypothetical protein
MMGYLTCETVIAGTSAADASSPKEIEEREECMFMMEVLLGFEESSAADGFWLERIILQPMRLHAVHLYTSAK